MNINITFDQALGSLPAGFANTVNAVVQFFDSVFTDPITINIDVGFGEVHGSALSSGAIGESNFSLVSSSYGQVRSSLNTDAKSADDVSSVASLPAADPSGGASYFVTLAEAKALGLISPNGTAIDGYAGFSSSANFDYDRSNGISAGSVDFFGVVAHEFSEIMGRVFGDGNNLPLDLFHYTAAHTRTFSGTTAGYFSVDDGVTPLLNFNTNPSGDFSDWANNAGADAFRAFAPSGTLLQISESDLRALDVVGYDRAVVSAVLGKPSDFNGDGTADILWQTDGGRAAVWLLNGLQTVGGDLVGPSVGSDWHIKGSADFNGDGRSDILWLTDGGRAAVWLVNATQTIGGDFVGPNVPASWHIVGTGDFNGDSHADILWQTDDGRAAIWLVNGTKTIGGDLVGPGLPASWHIVGSGDFNGDGKSDILWQVDGGRAAIWLVNGTQTIGGDLVGPTVPSGWQIKGVGDFNGDGKSDILWQTDTGRAAIWLMNGLTPIGGDIVGPAVTSDWHIKGAIDANGDGKSDILWQTDAGRAAVWLMSGLTPIGGDIVGPNPGTSWHVIAPTG